MGIEDDIERAKSSSSPAGPKITFRQAIAMGEYDPKYLATFAEWLELPRHTQFQYIREALENRRSHLMTQWAEISNFLNFSKKPELKEGLKNIEEQWKKLDDDREKLYLEYSK